MDPEMVKLLMEADRRVEMHDIRQARLQLAVALMNQGVDPKTAVVQAKDLVITLYAAAAS